MIRHLLALNNKLTNLDGQNEYFETKSSLKNQNEITWLGEIVWPSWFSSQLDIMV